VRPRVAGVHPLRDGEVRLAALPCISRLQDLENLPIAHRRAHNRIMNERVKQIADQARRLSADEQVELMDELLAMMHDGPAPVLDKALLEECERRWDAYKRGETKSYTWDEVKAQLRKL